MVRSGEVSLNPTPWEGCGGGGLGLLASGLDGPNSGGCRLTNLQPPRSPGFSVFAPESRDPQTPHLKRCKSRPAQQVLGQEDPNCRGRAGRARSGSSGQSPGQGENQSWQHVPRPYRRLGLLGQSRGRGGALLPHKPRATRSYWDVLPPERLARHTSPSGPSLSPLPDPGIPPPVCPSLWPLHSDSSPATLGPQPGDTQQQGHPQP